VEVHIYIGFETLKVKCTQYGICSQAAFKNGRAMFFCFRAGRATIFRRVWKKSGRGQKFRGRAAPARNMESLLVRGGYLTSSVDDIPYVKETLMWPLCVAHHKNYNIKPHVHNIIQIHNNVNVVLTIFYGIVVYKLWICRIFHIILSVPHNIIMDLNNVTSIVALQSCILLLLII